MRLRTYRKSSSFHISALSPLPFTSRVSYTSDKTRRIVAKSLFTQWAALAGKRKERYNRKVFRMRADKESGKKSHTSYKLCSINNTRTRDMRAGIRSCVRLDTHSTSFIFILFWFLPISTELAERRERIFRRMDFVGPSVPLLLLLPCCRVRKACRERLGKINK